MKYHRDYIPQNAGMFNDWFKNLYQYVGLKMAEWGHIQEKDYAKLGDAYTDWYTHYAPTLKPHTKAETKARGDAKKRAEKVIRPFVNVYLRYQEQVTNSDRINMGINVRADSKQESKTPTELVAFYMVPRANRITAIHFRVEGNDTSKARPYSYNGAVVYCEISDKPVTTHQGLTNSELATRTPFVIEAAEEQRGMYLSVACRWENAVGEKGPWSDIQVTRIP